MAKARDKALVHLLMEPAFIERLDDFRFANRFPSRNDAIRYLLEAALDQNPTPEPARRGGKTVAPRTPRRSIVLPRATDSRRPSDPDTR